MLSFLLLIGFIVVTIILFQRVGELTARVTRLEEQRVRSEDEQASQHATPLPAQGAYPAGGESTGSPYPVAQTGTIGGMVAYEPSVPHTPQQRDHSENGFIAWLKRDWLMKLGAFFLLLGMGWFLSYAIANNWIGEFGRILIGLVAGSVVMVGGYLRFSTPHKQQAGILMVVGSTTIIMSLSVARGLYDLFTPTTALLMMLASIVFVAFASIVHRRHLLALASMLLAVVAPLLTAAPDPSPTLYVLYLVGVMVGTLWIVFFTGWGYLSTVGVGVLLLMSIAPFTQARPEEQNLILLLASLGAALFVTSSTMALLRAPRENRGGVYLTTALLVAVYLCVTIGVLVPREWMSLLFVFWSLVFAWGSFACVHLAGRRTPFFVYGGVALVLLSVAAALETEGPTLTIFYLAEATLALVLTRLLLTHGETRGVALLFLVPGVLSLGHIVAPAWERGVLHGDALALVLTMAACVGVGAYIRRAREGEDADEALLIGNIFYQVGVLYALILVWLVAHGVTMSDDLGTFIALMVYTILGIGLYLMGRDYGQKLIMRWGGGLIGFVALHLILIDVWKLGIEGRVATFIVLGLLLMGAAFVARRDLSAPAPPPRTIEHL